MRTESSMTYAALASVGVLLCAISGCGQSHGAYAPTEQEARQALESTLQAWRSGARADSLASLAPAVHPVDFQWQAGQALEGYEILGEDQEPGQAVRWFTVRLGLKKARSVPEARFAVVGRGPVWVYRAEDYARVLDMDNNPKPAPKSPRRR